MCTNLKDLHFPTTQEEPWEPDFWPWRHGGWYVNVRYPSGACGCVSNNYTDKKWRIACGPYHGLTFSTRRDAANAERAMTLAMCEAEETKKQLLESLESIGNVTNGRCRSCNCEIEPEHFYCGCEPTDDEHMADILMARAAISKATAR